MNNVTDGLAAGLNTFAHLMGLSGEKLAAQEPEKPVEKPAESAPKEPEPKPAEPPAASASNDDVKIAERNRCASIFKAAAASVRPDMAAHLAFETDMAAPQAIAMLDMAAKCSAPRQSSLSQRMAANPNPNVGSELENKPEANSLAGMLASANAKIAKST